MNGSVFKRCPCTEGSRQGGKNNGAQLGTCKKNHGSWYFVHDPITPDGSRRRTKRGGYPAKEDAAAALARSLVKCGQRAACPSIPAGRGWCRSGTHRARMGVST
jgi:hypothetical protein